MMLPPITRNTMSIVPRQGPPGGGVVGGVVGGEVVGGGVVGGEVGGGSGTGGRGRRRGRTNTVSCYYPAYLQL